MALTDLSLTEFKWMELVLYEHRLSSSEDIHRGRSTRLAVPMDLSAKTPLAGYHLRRMVVCLAALGWLAGYNARLVSALQEQGLPEISALVAVLFLYGIIMLPLDWLGGTRLPQEYQMSYGLSSWKYVKAVLLHGMVWFAAILLLHQAGTLGGLSGALLTMSLIMVAAFAFQWPLAQCIGSFHQEKPHDPLRKRPTLEECIARILLSVAESWASWQRAICLTCQLESCLGSRWLEDTHRAQNTNPS